MMLLAMLLLPQEAGPADSIAQTFGVDGPHLLAQVISFAIVCALLYRLAYTPVLTGARDEASHLVAEAREAAKRVKQFEARRAIAEAERIVAKAHEAATQEHTRMLIELRGEVGRLVTRTTAAVTGKILTPDDHRRLADDTARQLSAS